MLFEMTLQCRPGLVALFACEAHSFFQRGVVFLSDFKEAVV